MANRGRQDTLSQELRAAEAAVDSAYASNPLVKLPFAKAAWYLLGVAEDQIFMPQISGELKPNELDAIVDNLKFDLKHAFHWLRMSCPPGGDIPTAHDSAEYQMADDLMELALSYLPFVAAFTFASRGLIEIQIHDSRLIPDLPTGKELQYEAYDRLLKPYADEATFGKALSRQATVADLRTLTSAVEAGLKVAGEHFTLTLNPKLLQLAIARDKPTWDAIFTLPGDWQFSRYTLADFKSAFSALAAIAPLHFEARFLAVAKGCRKLGFADCIFTSDRDGLVRRVTRYSGLRSEIVANIISDITLGARNLDLPDPALQPIIPLNKEHVALPAVLFGGSAAERNLLALMNRFPEERKIYARLVGQKEGLMRDRIVRAFQGAGKPYRYWWGTVPGPKLLPDVDLAIIDNPERACLLLELKWFIEPGESRELIQRSEEITKGVDQLVQLREGIKERYAPILDSIGIASDFALGLVVVSANATCSVIGRPRNLPVVREAHLVKQILQSATLLETISWLATEQFLPIEGKHFEVVKVHRTVGQWTIQWYAYRPLAEEYPP
jgi:hypothetical protein